MERTNPDPELDSPRPVYEYIVRNGPVEQDAIRERFGRIGVAALVTLLDNDTVGYTEDWHVRAGQGEPVGAS